MTTKRDTKMKKSDFEWIHHIKCRRKMEMDFVFENRITFPIEIRNNKIWLNTSVVARTLGVDKSPSFWIKRKRTKEFIDTTCEQVKCTHGKLIREIKDNSGKTVWMEAFVALEYLRWLPGNMAPWFAGKINGLIKDGAISCE